MTKSALLVEDDVELCEVLVPELERLGFSIDCAHDGFSALEKALSKDYAFVVLDIMLPKLDGVEVCRRVREKKPNLPILILSARDDEVTKVLLLEIGGDDYLTKPFSVAELRARIRAILRREARQVSSEPQSGETIICGDLRVHLAACSADFKGKPIDFTSGEYQIIALLASQLGRVFSRDEIVEAIHGTSLRGYDAAITTHINRVRLKLEPDPANPIYLQTVRGLGYRLVDPTAKKIN